MSANCRFLGLFGLLVLLHTGCATGPMAEYYAWNPFRKQGPEETQYGPSPAVRRAELLDLIDRAEQMTSVERAKAAADLAYRMPNEVDPLLRADTVRALGAMQAPASSEALRLAMKDSDAKVRIATCEAWRLHEGPLAVSALSEILASDADDDVRLAAARALGQFEDPRAVRGLSLALDDSNPALQYRAMESLKNNTGHDYGHDVVAWRNFVQNGGEPQRGRGPSLVERFTDRF